MGRIKVARVPDITHDEWLELRRTGIGGSDAPTIVGLNPYNSRFALYLDKIGEAASKESNEAMRQGHDFEQYVADRWMEATGKKCRRNNYMWRSTEHSYMLADIDREVCGENAGLECKTTSAYQKADLENGEIPLNYYAQCLHYMAVMGYDRMYLAVLVLGRSFHHFVIDRKDVELEIEALIEQEGDFWDNMVIRREPPAPDGSEATERAVANLYPASAAENIPAELTKKSLAMLRTIDDLDGQIKALQAAKKSAQAEVELEMGACSFGSVGEFRVEWQPQSRTTIDSKRLKAERPEIWDQYAKTTESRVFRTKKTKEASE